MLLLTSNLLIGINTINTVILVYNTHLVNLTDTDSKGIIDVVLCMQHSFYKLYLNISS